MSDRPPSSTGSPRAPASTSRLVGASPGPASNKMRAALPSDGTGAGQPPPSFPDPPVSRTPPSDGGGAISRGPRSRKKNDEPRRWWIPLLAMVALPLFIVGVLTAAVQWMHIKLDLFSFDSGPPKTTRDAGPVPTRTIVRGKVVDFDGDPVENANITVVGPTSSFQVLRSGTSDPNGLFTFLDLPPVHIHVIAEHPEEGITASAELPVAADGPPTEITLALAPGRRVKGVVTDEDGKPIASAQVNSEGPMYLPRVAMTAPDGTFSLPRLLPETLSVLATARGFAPSSVPLRKPADGTEEELTIRLRRAPDIEGRVVTPEGDPIRATVVACEGKGPGEKVVSEPDGSFRFPSTLVGCAIVAMHDEYSPSEPVQAVAGVKHTLTLLRGGSIRGRVVDDMGRAITKFSIGVETFVPTQGERTYSVRSGPAKPFEDPTGEFKYEKLAPGTYVLTALVDGRPPGRSTSIEVSADKLADDVKIVVPRGGVIEGTISDAQTREILVGATITFDSLSSTRVGAEAQATTGEDGRFRLEGAPSGPFSLRVEHPGHRTKIVPMTREASRDVVQRDILLTPTGDAGTGVEFSGIGANLIQTREGIALSSVFPGEPAARAGLLQGDHLRKIEGDSADGLSVVDAIQRLRGEPGTPVTLTVERPGADGWIEVTLYRATLIR
ncbi:MAG: carboxypeptidase regulatory-like domain-containing protein [Polyangiaceae bacterium]